MRRFLFALCTICILFSVPTGEAVGERGSPFLEVEVLGDVRYLSGGVGLEEREAMKALAKDFDLKLVFAMASGEYLSDIAVAIYDAQGESLLNTKSRGPWFFVKLPPGHYKITAAMEDQMKVRRAEVGEGLQAVFFLWEP